MFNANINGHYKTLKGWTKSAEFNRIALSREQQEQKESINETADRIENKPLNESTASKLIDNADTGQAQASNPAAETVDKSCGYYKVKMQTSQTWELMSNPPAEGASEWLFFNSQDIPVYYWSRTQEGLTII